MLKFQNTFSRLKKKGEKIKVITAYELSQARIAEAAGMNVLLVGDSLANVVLGRERTNDIGMDEMLLFTKAVSMGAQELHIIADMPYKSDVSPYKALENARKLISAGAHSVKLEGEKYTQIEAILQEGIPVVGHLGLTPQTAKSFAQVGKDPKEATAMKKAAKELEELGVSAIVLEHIPSQLAKEITESLSISTIGIGAGKDCDGGKCFPHGSCVLRLSRFSHESIKSISYICTCKAQPCEFISATVRMVGDMDVCEITS